MTNILSLPEAITHAYDTLKVHIHKNGSGTWNTVKGPMVPDFWPRHLKGDERFGVPFLVKDRCRAAMVDVDDHSSVGWDTVTRAVDAILNELSLVGLIGLPFRSGGGAGVNIWLIWSDDQQAAGVRAAIRAAIERAGYTVGAGGIAKGQVEIFPKQDKAHGAGNCAALPRTALDALTLEDIPLGQVFWSTSAPVPEVNIIEKPTGAQGSKLNPEQLEELLGYIPNDDLEYDAWWSTIMAIHDAGGTLEQAEAWSAKSTKHTPGYLPRKWRSITGDTERRVTVRTLKKMAADAGWEGSLVDVSVFPEPDDIKEINYPRIPGKGRYAGYINSNRQLIKRCMSEDPNFPWIIAFDEFTQEIVLSLRSDGEWTRLRDHHYYEMGVWFDTQRWEPVKTPTIREAVNAVAYLNVINLARSWALSLEWDGEDRYAEALRRMAVEIDDYTLAVARYWWTAHGARILEPGYKCDSVIVLVGEQETGKTKLIDTLAPKIGELRTYRDCNIEQLLSDDKSARVVRGALMLNLDEMRNYSRKEAAEVKACLSRTHESFIPKYIEFRHEFGRMCVIYATTNKDQFLDDETGNRRYHVLKVDNNIDLDWFEQNRDLLWAQGIHEFRNHGLAWKDASRLAPDHIQDHETDDVWEEPIAEYLETSPLEYETISNVLEVVCRITIDHQTKREEMRVAKILKNLGWKGKLRREPGKRFRIWERPLQF